jgi:hypothetical protein
VGKKRGCKVRGRSSGGWKEGLKGWSWREVGKKRCKKSWGSSRGWARKEVARFEEEAVVDGKKV